MHLRKLLIKYSRGSFIQTHGSF
uniref:Uncharacterized protein n=1 Tax=Anguilla anguilla TaxID=7936 RepID=A0A0E9SQ89_ANGAN